MNEEKTVPCESIQFAIFDGEKEISDEMYEEVKSFVAFLEQRKINSK